MLYSWTVCIALSFIDFSTLYKVSNYSDVLFLFCLVLLIGTLSLVDKIVFKKRVYRLKFSISKHKTRAFSRIGFFGLLLGIVEFSTLGVPLLNNIDYSEFGLPFIHVLVYGIAIFWAIYSPILFYMDSKSRGFVSSSLVIAYAVLIISRHLFIIYAISFFLSYLKFNSLDKKNAFKSFIVLFVVTTIFGVLGTYRMSNILDLSYSDSEFYILSAGKASDLYTELGMSSIYYWFWLYMVSPIYNLLLNLNSYSFFDFNNIDIVNGVLEFIPQTFSKRVMDFLGDSAKQPYLVANNLTASTSLVGPLIYLGLLGPLIYIIFLFCAYIIFDKLAKSELNRLCIEILFSTICVLSIFANIIVSPSFILALLIFALN